MNLRIRIWTLLCITCWGVTAPAAQPARSLKVMTYNIYNGFDYGKDTPREKATAAWIASEQPDVVAFQELCGFTEARLREFAAKWGHPYVAILKEEGFPVGVTSNRPITVKKKMTDGLWHGMLHVATHEIDFIVVHLCPADHPTRLRESEQLLAYMKGAFSPEKDRYMVLGDFNAHSPFDAFLDKRRPALLEKYRQLDSERKSRDHFQNLPHHEIEYSVLSRFLGFPLIDLCERKVKAEERFSFPSPIHFNPARKRGEVAPILERLDFILTCPRLADRCTLAAIINTGAADALSDHYPVIAEFAAEN